VVTWDTEVYNHRIFTSENLDSIESYEPAGGGGTDPACVWEFLKQNDIEPKKLIMFTDLCFYGSDYLEYESYCDTVWIIKGNPNAEPEFGVWAHYEEAATGKKR
jgi:predicted metal-dependent peptidase